MRGLVRYDDQIDVLGQPLFVDRLGNICTADGSHYGWRVSPETIHRLWEGKPDNVADDLADLADLVEQIARRERAS